MSMDPTALNEAQREAVLYDEGHLLVIAGAGSGKTRVLTHKIAYLLQSGISPYEIMALTFTNKAAAEMKSRIAGQVGAEQVRYLTMGTFHSVFLRILAREIEYTDYAPGFTIYDTTDTRSLIKSIVKEMELNEKVYKPQVIAARISDAKNRLLTAEAYAVVPTLLHKDKVHDIPLTHAIYSEYQRRMLAANAMDFDDLLLNTYLLLQQHTEVRDKYRRRYRRILVDEYQDTNYAQHLLIQQLCGRETKVCVVGDDAQSIYAFRGADIDNILSFQTEFAQAKVIKLEQNYRSTQTIVGAANSIIRHNANQIQKEVYSRNEPGRRIPVLPAYSDKEEGCKVAAKIRLLHQRENVPYHEMAVLYRTNAQSRAIEEALLNADLPYRIYGGMSFYQRKEIKDLLAYIRLVCNPNDTEALRRILNFPARGIGKVTENKIIQAAATADCSAWQVMQELSAHELKLSKATQEKLSAFCDLIETFRTNLHDTDCYTLTARIIRESGIMAEYTRDRSVESKSAIENMEEMLNAIQGFVGDVIEETGQALVTLPEYLSQVSLLTDVDDRQDAESAVTLMTIHAAKGLEFDAVFVTGLEEDLFPAASARVNPREMEEERRLFYVAVTRARRYCLLSYARSRFRYGTLEDCIPSHFIREIAPQYLCREEEFLRSSPILPSASRRSPFASPTSGSASSVSRSASPTSRSASPTPAAPSVAVRSRAAVSPLDGQDGAAGIRVGDMVQHERFGIGCVQRLEGSGVSLKACVEFQYAGTKTLLLKFAKLKVL